MVHSDMSDFGSSPSVHSLHTVYCEGKRYENFVGSSPQIFIVQWMDNG